MRAYFHHFEEFLAVGMRGWHERSDILGKKSKIHTLHEDILAVSEESIFSVRGDSLTEGGGCFLDMREKEAC